MLWDHDISYSYSSTLYEQVIDQQKKLKFQKLLAFAPAYGMEQNDGEFDSSIRASNRYLKNLYPIPGALKEVEVIKSIFPSDVFTSLLATEKTFRDTVSYYDIIHLAMHAVIDNKNPLYSKLIFTESEDSIYDGMLNTFEVFGLDLNARMVVLSACSTGEGEYSRGEGVLSLARGFVYAGTPSLVMTMWEVEDRSGALLMQDFYHNIHKGKSKSEALQAAKINYLKQARPENAHPFFWSSFAVLGNPDPLYYNKPTIILPPVALVLILLFLFFGVIKKKRNFTF